MKNANISKIIKNSIFNFLFLIASGSSLLVNAHLPDLKLFTDSDLRTISLRTCFVDGTVQIYHTTKTLGESLWTLDYVVSDPAVSVVNFNAKKDSNDNIVVGWIGENTQLGIRCLYISYFVKATNTWSPVTMVSLANQNLVGSFALTINTITAEVFWTIYDENFEIQDKSASYSLTA